MSIDKELARAIAGDRRRTIVINVVAGTAAVIILLGAWFATSWAEARAFNEVTGKNVSAWDAMWVDLRVQAEPSGSPP